MQRLVGYELMKYLTMDTLSGLGALAGYAFGGGSGAAVGFLAVAAGRGLVSAAVTGLRERGDKRWETYQEKKHRRSVSKDREHDQRFEETNREVKETNREVKDLRDEVAELRAMVAGQGGGSASRGTAPKSKGRRSVVGRLTGGRDGRSGQRRGDGERSRGTPRQPGDQ